MDERNDEEDGKTLSEREKNERNDENVDFFF